MKKQYSPLWLTAIMCVALVGCDNDKTNFMVGTLERDRVELSVESNEPIIALHVRDGQQVSTGELILEQDPTRLNAVIEQQLALQDQAAARLAELQRGPRHEAISEARAQLELSQALSKNTAANLSRARNIFERDLSDQASLDAAETRWKTAVAAEQAASESLASLLNGTTVEELQQATAVLAAATAQVSQVQLSLDRLKIYAPVSGTLDKQLFQLGERPRPGTTVAVILDDSRVFARIYVPESIRAQVRPGDSLVVRLDGYNQSRTGIVSWVSTDASFTPYFALTEHDRSRLSFLAEVDLSGVESLPSGVPLEVDFPAGTTLHD